MERLAVTRFSELEQVDAMQNEVEFERDVEGLINMVFIVIANKWT